MLKAAKTFAHRHDEKPIILHGRRMRAWLKESNLCVADSLQIGDEPRRIAAVAAGDGDMVGGATGEKRGVGKVTHFNRVVD